MPTSPITVVDERTLAEFRQGLTGPTAIDMLNNAGGRLLVQLPVGDGKTRWIQEIVRYTLRESQTHDLILIMAPQWGILRELAARLPTDLGAALLEGRPQGRCGELDRQWRQYESAGCSLLARQQLCGMCPAQSECRWLVQYREALRGTRLILAAQQNLNGNPCYAQRIQRLAEARRPLLLLDETDQILTHSERTLRRAHLDRFRRIVAEVTAQQNPSPERYRCWSDLLEVFCCATTNDLQASTWDFPAVDPDWALDVQQRGNATYGPQFQFLGYELSHFRQSDAMTRERLANGDLRYTSIPHLGNEFIIFSGTMSPELVRFRLDPSNSHAPLGTAFANYQFRHTGTRWFNITSLAGSARYFRRNASYILQFFAEMIARNMCEGRRTLLVARKQFIPECVERLEAYLRDLGHGSVRIVADDWDSVDLYDPANIAIINYGICGLNQFEHVECAYCLTGYYTDPQALERFVRDLEPTTSPFSVSIAREANPTRRVARVEFDDDRQTILPRIAQDGLEQLEGDRIVQAVGRVRPFTNPREVIKFHAGQLPGVRYDLTFTTLPDARTYFSIPTRRRRRRETRADQTLRLKQQGRTNRQIAAVLRVSLSTVKRDLRLARRHSQDDPPG